MVPDTDLRVTSLNATWRLARRLADAHPRGGVLALQGPIGCGETTMVQGIAAALGVREPVTSPTFALVNTYAAGTLRLVHMDLYRLASPDELWTLDFDAYLEAPDTLVAIEWPERAAGWLPPHTRKITILPGPRPTHRRIRISPPLP